jgi:hypothetical protein
MSTQGKTVIRENGKRGLLGGGKGAVFVEGGSCRPCCGCDPTLLGSYVTSNSDPVWNLTPYQGDGMASAYSFWRLIEMSYCFPKVYPFYGAG